MHKLFASSLDTFLNHRWQSKGSEARHNSHFPKKHTKLYACRYFSFCIVTNVVLQLLAVYFVGLMIRSEDYQPHTSSFTTSWYFCNTLRLDREKASGCWVRATSLWTWSKLESLQSFSLWPSAMKLVKPNLWSPSQWPLECRSDSHGTDSLTALTVTARPHMQTQHKTRSIMLPLLFPECQLSLGSFDCIDCNDFSVHTMINFIVITIIIAATLTCVLHTLRGSRLWFIFFHVRYHLDRKYYNNNNYNNSSSDKDDNPWLDECLLICVWYCCNLKLVNIWITENRGHVVVKIKYSLILAFMIPGLFSHFQTMFLKFFYLLYIHLIFSVQWMYNCVFLFTSLWPPPPRPSPLLHSPSVSLAVCLCSLSMCSAKPVSK